MNLLLLYLEFFKIGIFAVGGGLATLPFLFLMTNDRFTFIRQGGWLGTEQLGNFIAIAQCSPGAIGVNIAMQTGFLYGSAGAAGFAGGTGFAGGASGIAGGFCAIAGLISPAIIVISIISKVLQSIKENKITEAVFRGLRPAATGLLSNAGLGVWRIALYNPAGEIWYGIIRLRESVVCIIIFLLILKFKKHPILYIALGAVAGIVLGL